MEIQNSIAKLKNEENLDWARKKTGKMEDTFGNLKITLSELLTVTCKEKKNHRM